MRLKPCAACTSMPSSGTGSVFSESSVISVSCTSLDTRVSSSTRASLPSCIARSTGEDTSAAGEGPSASRRA